MKEQDGEIIRYIDGYAWGISLNGETVCLGTEPTIREIIATNKKPRNPTIASVITTERKLLSMEKVKIVKENKKIVKEKEERHQRAIELGVAKERKRGKRKVSLKKKR